MNTEDMKDWDERFRAYVQDAGCEMGALWLNLIEEFKAIGGAGTLSRVCFPK